MIRGSAIGAVALSAILLAGCQSNPRPLARSAPSIEGDWRSGDGVSVSTFSGGQLVTRFVETNEVLAQGSYTLTGNQASMQFVSNRTRQNRSATCVFAGPDVLNCESTGGGPAFVLNRSA